VIGAPFLTFLSNSGRLVRVVRVLSGGIDPWKSCSALGFGPSALWQM
jgi:hypothetical protein